MADVAAPPTFKKRTNKTSNLRKRPATPPPEQAPATDSDYITDDDDNAGQRVKRRKKDGVQHTTTTTASRPTADLQKSTTFTADRSTTLTANDSATKTSHWTGVDPRAAPSNNAPAAAPSDGTYHGTAAYTTHISRNPDTLGRSSIGPVKAAPGNVRTITVTDFAPDVCKDYKTTGFCGFGDSCKFLHAREDYKQGWQLDREWENVGSKKAATKGKNGAEADTLDDEEKLLESIPFKCIICKDAYKRPVVTRCGHYFCEKCAMVRYMREKKRGCANCGADTGGTFNVARKLEELLERKRRREEAREAAEKGEGGEEG